MEVTDNAKSFLAHATTLKLHTGNLVNRCRLKNKCPSSPSEEVKKTLFFTRSKESPNGFKSTSLSCCVRWRGEAHVRAVYS